MSKIGPYELDSIVVGDCLDVMRQMPDGCVDLVVTDPPYGYGKFGKWDTNIALNFYDELANSLSRIMSPGACLYLFPGWMFYCEARKQLSATLHYLKTLIWDRRTFTAAHSNAATLTYHNIAEPILLLYNDGAPLTFNLEDVRVPTIHNDPRSNPLGKRPGDIIPCIGVRNNAKEKVAHPTQKPRKLIEIFIKASSNPFNLIFDPFLGSGTTAVAAKKLGRHFFGCDISEEYVKMARNRVAKINGIQLDLPLK